MIPESLLIQGLMTGVMYALLACGLTLVYGVSGIINLAHTAFYMLGGYLFFFLGPWGYFQLPLPVALILAPIVVGILGVVSYILVMSSLGQDFFGVMVVSIGLAMIIQQSVLITFGPKLIPWRPLVKGSILIWRAGVTYSQIIAFAIAITLFILLWIFTMKTKIGTAMRALSQDPEVIMLMGINVKKMCVIVMFIGTVLAAFSGISIISAVTRQLTPYIWMPPLTTAFSIVILGGLGSVKGSLVGGLILGYVETTVISIIPTGSYLVHVVSLTIMLLVLLIRPSGLFGKHIERV